MLRDTRNERGCETCFWTSDERERIYIETLDAVYEDMESLTNMMLLILCDVGMLRIARYKMY